MTQALYALMTNKRKNKNKQTKKTSCLTKKLGLLSFFQFLWLLLNDFTEE
jgi:hypothetical protein